MLAAGQDLRKRAAEQVSQYEAAAERLREEVSARQQQAEELQRDAAVREATLTAAAQQAQEEAEVRLAAAERQRVQDVAQVQAVAAAEAERQRAAQAALVAHIHRCVPWEALGRVGASPPVGPAAGDTDSSSAAVVLDTVGLQLSRLVDMVGRRLWPDPATPVCNTHTRAR